MDKLLELLGREGNIFQKDLLAHENSINDIVSASKFLVIGGAGSIGQAVSMEIFKRKPKCLHVVDISENNLVELVRDIRSSLGYINGDFSTYAIDIGSDIFTSFINSSSGYDYIFNLSALKHVRSEKDQFTLMRMIDVNIFDTKKVISHALKMHVKKYFCVSTDKATNPVNLMGASKRMMENYLLAQSEFLPVTTARFANVAFSDGSLLYGFGKRVEKNQPLSAPYDIKRYFITPVEAGELCLLACLLGENRDLYFPKLNDQKHLLSFTEMAERYLDRLGYKAILCSSEEEARMCVNQLKKEKKWPVYFFESDTTGEKEKEEFYSENEKIDWDKYNNIAVIKNNKIDDLLKINKFEKNIQDMREKGSWSRNDIINAFIESLPELKHKEKGKFLDKRM